MADGLLGKCKECAKKDVRENRHSHSEYYKAFDRTRQKDPKRRLRKQGYIKLYRHRNRDATKAHGAVARAIATGRLKQGPCEVCGSRNVVGHHEDYSKALGVRWMCQPHHVERHQEMKAKGISPRRMLSK